MTHTLYFSSDAHKGGFVDTPDRNLLPKTEKEPNAFGTPRPMPSFFQEPRTFSTKKERGTPRDSLPPKPPVKSAPPVSRIFPQKVKQTAQPVSFRTEKRDSSILGTHYNETSKELYFDQSFAIESRIGVGAFGEVFKVRSRDDGRLYAVKRSRERFRGESDRRRKLGEVDKHEKLPKHPNCVQFVKAWEEKQHLYIQTELCKTSLSSLAENVHNFSEKLVWKYLVDLLMAVKHLHDHDLVHMDIKPENIFISEHEVCKLGDFGLVIDLNKGEGELSESQEGDPKYLAPELMRGQFGKHADIFSLGVTIFELASDIDLPRGGALWHQLRSGRLPESHLSNASAELRALIGWMMEPNPELRPTVDQLLLSSNLHRLHRRRRLEHAYRRVCWSVKSAAQEFFSLLLTFVYTVTYPLQSWLPRPVCNTPTKDIAQHPPEWDHSFSDDDLCPEDEVNISNNSMGAPLNFSTSSEDISIRDEDGFARPPPLKAKTTPGRRFRPQGSMVSPALTSTSSPKSFLSSSPVSSPASLRCQETTPGRTPSSLRHKSVLQAELDEQADHAGDVLAEINMTPKNLLEVFESTTDDEI